MQQLQPNTSLQGGKYKIIKVLGQGGFGITYLAEHTMLGSKVAIKEFFMKEFCNRDDSTNLVSSGSEGSKESVNRFREKFIKEARNIAKLKHPNIVNVIDVFEENGTAYYVMEYVENGSLADKVKQQGYLSEPVATRYILQVASALEYIHQQKMNHLDVKPANIMVNEKDEAVLIDFGLSKRYDAITGNQTSTTPVGISEGYAPMEQYKQGGVGEFSPETDIYALGATFFKLLTGVTPPSAFDVNEDGVPISELKTKGVSQKAIDVICKAMEGRKKNRMNDVRTFVDGLNGKTLSGNTSKQPKDDGSTTIFINEPKKDEQKLKSKEKKKSGTTTKLNIWVGIAALCILAFVIAVSQRCNSSNDSNSDEILNPSSDISSDEINEIDGHEYVDLGLPSGTLWATCNVGASKPEEYGDYFAWGETIGYNSGKTNFDWSTYKYCNGSYKTMTKYCTGSSYGTVDNKTVLEKEKCGIVDNKTVLEAEDDAATANWGSNWRMPADDEFDELINSSYTTTEWTTMNGVYGRKITSKKNGNSIFLPAAGYRGGTNLYNAGSYGDYWSSSLSSSYSDDARVLDFISSNVSTGYDNRYFGLSVRPVRQ